MDLANTQFLKICSNSYSILVNGEKKSSVTGTENHYESKRKRVDIRIHANERAL